MPLSSTTSTTNSKKGICLLSLDAGGSRGISQLRTLVEIMHRLNFESDETKLPCTVFNMIGGVGSGGFIAILLVIFGLTAEQALEEFVRLTVEVLEVERVEAAERSVVLKHFIEGVMHRHGFDKDARIMALNRRSVGCKLILPISYKENIGSTCTIRNVEVRQEVPIDITVVDAMMSTLAMPHLFPPVSIEKDASTFHLLGGELNVGNPVELIIAEAHAAFGPGERVACLLSLGCGHAGIISTPDDDDLGGWKQFVNKLVTDCDHKAQSVEARMGHLGIYHRFSVQHGLEKSSPSSRAEPGRIIMGRRFPAEILCGLPGGREPLSA